MLSYMEVEVSCNLYMVCCWKYFNDDLKIINNRKFKIIQ